MENTVLLLQQMKQGDKTARNKMVEENLGLVHHVVKRFLHWGYDREELFQVGCIGLMKAVDKFDTEYEVQFSTYAVPMIQGEIKRFLRDDGVVKVSRSIKENSWKVQKMRAALVEKLGHEPTLSELSQACELSAEDVVLALNATVEVESLQKSVYRNDEQELCLADQIVAGDIYGVGGTVAQMAARSSSGVYEDVEKLQLINHMMLKDLLQTLSEEERLLIDLRYYQNKTQTQVAKEMGLNQVKVSRMEKRILLSMRQRGNIDDTVYQSTDENCGKRKRSKEQSKP